MTARVVRFEGSLHQQVFELLPWQATGTLDAAEAETVEHHLAACTTCQRELAWLRELHGIDTAAVPSAAADAAWDRFRKRIDARSPAQPRRTAVRFGWLRRPSLPLPGWAAFALVAQLSVIGALSWVLAGQPSRVAEYGTLSASSFASDGGNRLVVRFDPNLRERDLRRLLRTLDAQVVAGPMESNVYVLGVPAGTRDGALGRLRREPAVTLAEPLELGKSR